MKKAKKEEAAEETPAVEEKTSDEVTEAPAEADKPTPSNTDREERCPEGGALFAPKAISTGVSCDADLPHKLKQS